MGVMVNGKWHEELADPSDSGGSNLTDVSQSPTNQGGGGSQGSTSSSGGGGGTPTGAYQTVNGQQTIASMTAQLQAAGWGGGEDVPTAYARTTGGAVTPVMSGGGGDSGAGATGGSSAADAAAAKKAQQEADVVAGFKESSGFSREQLAETKREFDANIAQKQIEWEREGLPTLVIAQRTAALEDAKFQETVRQFNATQTESSRQFDLTQAENARQFNSTQGLDYLKTAASLSGPSDYFQSVDFNRGASARGDVPVFLGALGANTALPSFNAPGQATQNPLTMGSLANNLTGGGAGGAPTVVGTDASGNPMYQTANGPRSEAQIYQELMARGYAGPQDLQSKLNAYTGGQATGYNQDQALQQIGSIFKNGATGLAAGSLERLDPNELALLKSGAGKLGYDYDSWIRNYQKSGVGQAAGAV